MSESLEDIAKRVRQNKKRAYNAANKEKVAEYHRAYYAANKEKLAEYQRAYYAANKEKVAERNRANYAANKEKVAAMAAEIERLRKLVLK